MAILVSSVFGVERQKHEPIYQILKCVINYSKLSYPASSLRDRRIKLKLFDARF